MAASDALTTTLEFNAPSLWNDLHALKADPGAYDSLEFGLVAMDLDGAIVAYNAAESRFAGVSAAAVIGLIFFTDVAPCTNNYLVAGRFEDETTLDETIDYIFTVKMRPTHVKLRMLKNEDAGRQYLVVQWT